MTWLINAVQLDKLRKSQKNIAILDASWFLPADNRDAKQEFLANHISGARFLDLNDFNDTTSNFTNMLVRDEKIINEKVGLQGITNEHKIIFYDNSDKHTSCRAFWMFKTFGHNMSQLYILDGGLEAWQKYGGKIESGEPRPANKKNYQASFQAQFIRTLVQVKANMHHPQEQVVDMRHPVRYAGGPEVKPGLRLGHIPGSRSFPYFTMFEANGHWKPIEKIRKQLTGIGVNVESPIITTCGSGITAPILNFALDLMGQTQHAVYNGSWQEWGENELFAGEVSVDERPVVTSLLPSSSG